MYSLIFITTTVNKIFWIGWFITIICSLLGFIEVYFVGFIVERLNFINTSTLRRCIRVCGAGAATGLRSACWF